MPPPFNNPGFWFLILGRNRHKPPDDNDPWVVLLLLIGYVAFFALLIWGVSWMIR